MPTKFDDAFAKVQKLVAIFESGKDHYLSGDYQEVDVRKDFIDKFFIALGWDVNHDEQTNPYAQEVKVERGVNEGLARKRADYAFLLAPNYRDVRFYVEAKRPSNDFGSGDNCLQAIRYGWFTKKTSPFAVLTSFEDFHILDCRLKPNINDTLSRVIERFSYPDYVNREKFARIYWLFSREAVASGSFEKFAESRPVARGKKFQRGVFKGGDTQPDEDFLEELDAYRQKLAKAFKDANPDLDGETLTEVTQRTLDRLVFTRFLEDKGIESPVIENFGKQDGFWEDFINASLRLDRKYNGVVFKFHPRLDVKGFKPDEKVFARICEELTDSTSPYNFNIIPIHILGSIYERFLGKVISDKAKVEWKPENRKNNGVYYTPEYIVRYIVENTVGKMIEGKNPEEISKLKFADIACGSGSFLLGVYDVLLKYHAEYYSKNPGKVRKGDCVRRDGTLHLSLQKKRDILTNNLYGVDIDRQAVEVAQLSLYLKLLEDETVGTTSEFQDEFHFTLLPSLDKNIVCGNSLIGPDIADGGALTDEEEKKINPLDYAQRFPTIFRRKVSGGELRESDPGEIAHSYPGGMPLHGSYAEVNYKKSKKKKAALPRLPESEYEGGFDAIVGNPPYIRIQVMQESSPESVEYFKKRYAAASKGNYDIYVVFGERALQLLNSKGKLGYILPHKFFNSQYGAPFRQTVSVGKHLDQIVHFSSEQVFDGATTYTCLLFLSKKSQPQFRFVKVASLEDWRKSGMADEGKIPAGSVTSDEWNFNVGSGSALFEKLRELPLKVGDVADIFVGLQTSADDVFIMELVEAKPKTLRLKSKILEKEFTLERDLFFPLVSGTDVSGYCALPERQYILFPYAVKNEQAELIPFAEISKQFPKTAAYLTENKKRLEGREKGKFKDDEWHRFGRNQNLGIQQRQKICVPRLVDELCAAYDESGIHFLDNVDVGGVTFKPDRTDQTLPYLLALLNSKLLRWYFPFVSAPFRGGWMSANKQFLSQVPFHPIDFSNPADKSRHDRLVELVEQMLAAKAKLPSAKTEGERDRLENKCATLDQQMDTLVYELYGLTAEEIKLVEGA